MTAGRKRLRTILGRLKKLKPDDEMEIVRRYVDLYWTINELAQRYGVSVISVGRVLDRYRIRRRSTEEVNFIIRNRLTGTPLTEEEWDRRIEEETAKIQESWSEAERLRRTNHVMQPLSVRLVPIRIDHRGLPAPKAI